MGEAALSDSAYASYVCFIVIIVYVVTWAKTLVRCVAKQHAHTKLIGDLAWGTCSPPCPVGRCIFLASVSLLLKFAKHMAVSVVLCLVAPIPGQIRPVLETCLGVVWGGSTRRPPD